MKKFVINNSVFGSELISNTLCFFTELRHNISKAEGQVIVSCQVHCLYRIKGGIWNMESMHWSIANCQILFFTGNPDYKEY